MNEGIKGVYKKVDLFLFLLAAVLSVFGVVLLRALVINNAATIAVTSSLYKNQALITVVAWVICFILCALDYEKIVRLWFIYAPLAIVLSLLVFTSLGIEVAGDKAWLDFKVITIQPSELLKVAFITTFALHLSAVGDKVSTPLNVLLLCAHAAIPLFIVHLQGDDGTLCVFLVIFVVMLFSAGISIGYVIAGVAALPVGVWFVWNHVMSDFQKNRFKVLLDDSLDPQGIGYHQRVSKLALGSGQLSGKGFNASEYVEVPEAANDFIFTFVGQCCGFIGCAIVIVIFLIICLKVLANSRAARDPLGKYICVGVFAMIMIHCVLNIGMVLGKFPVIGVPLPFMSQGGTSALASYIGIGLVMSTYSHSEKQHHVFYDDD